MQLRVLIMVGENSLRSRVLGLMRDKGVFVRTPGSRPPIWDSVKDVLCDVLIADRPIIPDPAAEHIAELRRTPNAPAVIVLWSGDDPAEVAELCAAGADATLHIDSADRALAQALEAIVDKRRAELGRAVTARRMTPRPALSDFVSTSPAMKRFLQTVYRVADSDAPLLITGETGVGKERLARAIHCESRRADGSFISVNCGAIPENLLESQLFGHEKGAFTGATKNQRGCFELAHEGTLFLDEVSEMPFHLQVKLLHVLQDYEIRPVGAERSIPVDVRVIAATNRDIAEEVEERRFRKDLFYRLSVVSINVPPLRERKGDIPALTEAIVRDLSARISHNCTLITPESVEALCRYEWPGNVRELINVLERAILLCEDECVTVNDLPDEIAVLSGSVGTAAVYSGVREFPAEWLTRPLKDVRESAIEWCERTYLEQLLRLTEGRVGETARRADLEPRSLFNKMKRYGLRKEDFRPGDR